MFSLYESFGGQFYVGIFGQGLYILILDMRQFFYLIVKDGLFNGSILDIMGSGFIIWLVILGGVNSFQEVLFGECFVIIFRFDEQFVLGINFIYIVFLDSYGWIWFGMDGEGLSVFEDGKFYNYNIIDSIDIQAVYFIIEDKQGYIWFSIVWEGVFEYDGVCFCYLIFREGICDLVIISLIMVLDGNIVIVYFLGVDLLDFFIWYIIYYDEGIGVKGLEFNFNVVVVGSGRLVWLGMENRVFRYIVLEEFFSIYF